LIQVNLTVKPTATEIVPLLEDVFARRGDDEYLGEPVTMSAHMLQCAQFAEQNNDSEQIIVAALLHDVGHFIGEMCPQLVVDCVRFHVPAKRYLCKVEPAYFDGLSEASVHSLKLQGGPMTDSEVAEFASNPHVEAIIKVRRYDDMSKIPDQTTSTFSHYAPIIQRVVDQHQNS